MSHLLSESTKDIIKATIPALSTHGQAITSEMYTRLFQDEEIQSLCNHSNQGQDGKQVKALAAAILGYAQNIDHLEVLAPTVERIAQKHIGYDIKPEHYPSVANALLGAIEHVLGAAATQEILSAWGEAYWALAGILMAREKSIRDDIAAEEGGGPVGET